MPNTKLPGSRILAEILEVHRKTIIATYDELKFQGWIQIIPYKGTFVNSQLPILKKIEIPIPENSKMSGKGTAGFSFTKNKYKHRLSFPIKEDMLFVGDGIPDNRLIPIDEIATLYRSVVKRKQHIKHFGYGSAYGNLELRKSLVKYLNETRGLSIDIDQILITRGSQMGLYLASKLIIGEKKEIVVGNSNYRTANDTFIEANGRINNVSVDNNGLIIEEIADLCKHKKIAIVYVTSHHHYPTTVTLSAERRVHLLALAKKYKFAIIEDDYDYDFNYNNAPIMPLASIDINGSVVYIGSISKILAPGLRIGYLIASKDFITEAAESRKAIDKQGDHLMEITMSYMIKEGNLQRHSKKTLKIYKQRRDLFCYLLKERLGEYFDFEIPNGGMAIWVTLDKKYDWDQGRNVALDHNLYLHNPRRYHTGIMNDRAIRMGFSSLNETEIRQVITILENVFSSINKRQNITFVKKSNNP
ncbi:PLP-dependent aminotransferase family protein [Aquimarina addita]|uniref:PLP-dependent aminotransferase family protein n=2 Tax=Aquimarina addita TaxID=870485 RepID=A0ABP6UP90_9FLAO